MVYVCASYVTTQGTHIKVSSSMFTFSLICLGSRITTSKSSPESTISTAFQYKCQSITITVQTSAISTTFGNTVTLLRCTFLTNQWIPRTPCFTTHDPLDRSSRTLGHNNSRDTPRDLCCSARLGCPTGGGGKLGWSKVKLRNFFEKAPRIAFLPRPFSGSAQFVGAERKIAACCSIRSILRHDASALRCCEHRLVDIR